jgi:hypothetical protein
MGQRGPFIAYFATNNCGRLLLTEQGIDNPAAANMRPFTATVVENVLIVAPGVLQGVGKDRQAVEGTVVVDGLGDPANCAVVPGEPCRVSSEGPEWVAENTSE